MAVNLSARQLRNPRLIPTISRILEQHESPLVGRRVLVTAGPTREAIDPVRFLSNHSSGRMGTAVAAAAWRRGAEVTLVAGPLGVPVPVGVRHLHVESTAEMQSVVERELPESDVLVMAAAPADYRPRSVSDTKIKKAEDGSAPALELEQNPDILAEISHDRARPGSVIVGFAAETGDASSSVLDLARTKLARKGCDLLVVNDVSGGKVFGSPENEAVVLDAAGEATHVPRGAKSALAHAIWDRVAARFEAG